MPASLIHPFDSMARPGGHGEISVLITSPFPGDHQYFTEVLSQPDIRVLRALNLRQAEPQIRSLPVAVVITEKELPDGTWKDIQRLMESRAPAALLIVASRTADEYLWSEVLNAGGFDVLSKPFRRQETTRVLAHAVSRYHPWPRRLAHRVTTPG